MMLSRRVGIVTGGPGTGKTSCLHEYLDRAPKNLNIALCAPTGKAAKRLAEATQHSATTIHRLLGAAKGSGGWVFQHGPHNFLTHDVLICDEASMLDAETCQYLLDAVNTKKTAIFFIGDVNQLPSVGPGQVFADLIDSSVHNGLDVVRLTHVHRAAAESWVCRNAPYILDGDLDIITPCPDFKFYDVSEYDRIPQIVVDLVTNKMPAKGISDVQVMSPQNGGPLGVEELNVLLQSRINPTSGRGEKIWSVRASKGTVYHLKPNDLVLETTNDYKRFVFNGEIGTIEDIDTERKRMFVRFDDRIVEYDREEARSLRLAYATTVHKNQGSESAWVVVVCHDLHEYMWNQALLYTAVTRAKIGVVLVGNTAGIAAALMNDDPRRRVTTLEDRLG